MDPLRAICEKRDGGELDESTIRGFISGFAAETVPDYQMAAMAMAIYLQGMSDAETAALTDAMLNSGKTLQWSDERPVVDKHSTGGIGDKVSLVLAPLLACCDLLVPMISGRGLGPTGGTLDKLESIPGFNCNLSLEQVQAITLDVGCVIAGASEQLAPADRKLYALRDVTGTVASIPLITASIMSKKLAESLDALVLDVKFGSGAFMKSLASATALAESLVGTGRRMGVNTMALLTDMNQPLGRMVGNAVEVQESIDCLRCEGPDDLQELVLRLGTPLLAGATGADENNAFQQLLGHLESGRAMERFEQMVVAQSGRLETTPRIATSHTLESQVAGYVKNFACEQLGWAIIDLGGGRRKQTDPIDHSVGLEVLIRVGDFVQQGQPIFRVFADASPDAQIFGNLRQAVVIEDDPVDPLPLIHDMV